MTAGEALAALWPDGVPGDLVGCARAKSFTGTLYVRPEIWTADLDRLAAWIERTALRHDAYVSVAAQDRTRALARKTAILHRQGARYEATPKNTRGFSSTASALPCVAVDVDLARPGAHSAANLPTTIGEALAALGESPLPEPTTLISSGYGLYALWMFREPWEFEPVDECAERARAGALTAALQRCLRETWSQHGWTLDATADLSRVLRPVGSRNHKLGESRPVEIIGGSGARYNPGKIEDAIPERHFETGASGARRGGPGRPAESLPIVHGCAWVRHCHENRASLPEPEWYALLSVLGRCVDGRALAHEFSRGYENYSESETDAKLAQALAASGPVRCARVRAEFGVHHCAGCPAAGLAASPISLGYLTPAAAASARARVATIVGGDHAR